MNKLILLAFALTTAALPAQSRKVTSLDGPWQFTQSDPITPAIQWQTVTVPHDWVIAQPLDKANSTGQGGAYAASGIAWYKHEITAAPGRHTWIAFDGVMANSEVFLNGTSLGKRPNGNVSFHYDLTPYLHPGSNTLTVRTDTSKQPANRWYEGNGIYRSVRLIETGDVHIDPWGTVVTTPNASPGMTMVHITAQVENQSSKLANPALVVTLLAPDGKLATKVYLPAKSIAPNKNATFDTDIPVSNPALWNLDTPNLYKAVVEVATDNKPKAKTLDADTVPFGIREFHFDPNLGFFLNGRNFKIKGAAMHADGGAVGIAVPAAIYERRLRALKALGVNAIRTAHNPFSPDFLDLCDRIGLLVMDEMFDQWTVAKNPYDYHLYFEEWALKDTRDTVRRDRNHPSIILYSAGNEIHDTPNAALANRILTSLVKVFHEEDPTRPVTQGLFRPNVSHDYDNGLADLLDVVGQNYREREILAAHDSKPTRKIIGTENTHEIGQWLAMRDHPAYSGQFLWAGIDYLGEAGEAGGWPIFANGSGLLDRTAIPRARGFERESWWLTTPNIHIARRIAPTEKVTVDPGYENAPARFKQVLYTDWTPQNQRAHEETVEVYTNAEEADLVLNGVPLGRQKLHADASPLVWKVPYAPGKLEAVAYLGGKEVSRDTLRTAHKATHLQLETQRTTLTAGLDEALTVEVSLRDENNTLVPDSTTPFTAAITGPATLIATDTGNNADHTAFTSPTKNFFQGRAIILLRATAAAGKITLSATSPGLTAATTSLQAVPTPTANLRSF